MGLRKCHETNVKQFGNLKLSLCIGRFGTCSYLHINLFIFLLHLSVIYFYSITFIDSMDFSLEFIFVRNYYFSEILLRVNNRNNRTRSEMCSKLTIKTPDRPCSSVSVTNFEHVNADWEFTFSQCQKKCDILLPWRRSSSFSWNFF